VKAPADPGGPGVPFREVQCGQFETPGRLMNHWHLLLLVLVAASASYAAADEKSKLRPESGPGSECVCPKEGRWKAQNLEGWMNCTGPVNIKRKLDEVKDKGTIWVLDNDCASLFAEASRKRDEDVLMARTEGCGYQGTINGEENGVNMVIEIVWTAESDTFIKGEMHSNPSLQGMLCEYYRPFELSFDEPIGANEYAKLKQQMEKKLDKVRKSN
jgi:hypothetical protein